MIYLIYGNKSFNIKKKIDEIKKNFNPLNISAYDLIIDNIKEILEDASTISLFGEKKLILP